jgi:hypothetical protein
VTVRPSPGAIVPGSGDVHLNVALLEPAQAPSEVTSMFAVPMLRTSNVFATYVPARTPVPKLIDATDAPTMGVPAGA